MGDNLPVDSQQPQPHNIVLTGQIMPTPAKAWSTQVPRQKHTPEVPWVSWLPMKHYRRNAWTPWLRGQVRWWGTGAPGERLPALCVHSGQQHGESQSRLAYCFAQREYWDLWCRSRTTWTHYACRWRTTATSHELWLCARLLIPPCLINAVPKTERHKLRTEVGLFQLRMIQAVQTLRRKLADPTPQQSPSPLWLTRLAAQPLPPRETARNLREQVGAQLRYFARHRKRQAETTTCKPIDSELWL